MYDEWRKWKNYTRLVKNMKTFNPVWKDVELYRELYFTRKKKATVGLGKDKLVAEIIEDVNPYSIWDYGCGHRYPLIYKLKKIFPDKNITGYDPVFLENTPIVKNYITDEPVDMIICTDVLEHLWYEELTPCFNYWKNKTPKYIFCIICNRPSSKTLADGSNPHKILETKEWWISMLLSHFPEYKLNPKHTFNLLRAKRTVSNTNFFGIFIERSS
jgi:hypothetical protein